jgi:hypothetical protein
MGARGAGRSRASATRVSWEAGESADAGGLAAKESSRGHAWVGEEEELLLLLLLLLLLPLLLLEEDDVVVAAISALNTLTAASA